MKKLSFQGIEESSIDTMMTDRIFWPQDMMTKPFGEEGKEYDQ